MPRTRTPAQRAQDKKWGEAVALGKWRKSKGLSPAPRAAPEPKPVVPPYEMGLAQGERSARADWARGFRPHSISDSPYYKGVRDGYEQTLALLLKSDTDERE